VANDCDLSPPDGTSHGAIWLLTGPNMGGKSTFLRQNALIAILAQAGLRAGAIGPYRRRRPAVLARRRLRRSRARALDLHGRDGRDRRHPQPGGERSLVILDEIGRGTATYDGLSIAWAALEHLHEVNRCRALFATHFHEMTALAERLSRLSNVTMRVKEWEGDVVFLHEVARGRGRPLLRRSGGAAGRPAPCGRRTRREVLHMLEKARRPASRPRIVDDLPLFSAAVKKEPAAPTRSDAVTEALAAILPDEMTPREALETLYRLKALAEGNKRKP
jgi:DNA mismatch repair protein MutS